MKGYFKALLMTLALILAALVTTNWTSQPTHATGPWYVAPSGNDSNPCTSPATACATINGAIAKASPGDTIYVTTGTYTGTGDEVVLLDKNVTLSGGWNNAFTTQDGISTIDGQVSRRGITVNSDVNATVDRFTIQGGTNPYAGGIYNAGTLTFTNGTILNNEHSGIGNYSNGTVILNNTVVSGNTASGIHVGSGTVTLNHSTVSSNLGCGISNHGTLTLNHSTISGNRYGCWIASGGGIWNEGTLTVNYSTISGNAPGEDGGGVLNKGGTLTLNNSIVSENTATTGGGIRNVGGNAILNNSTVSGNTAEYGGGINNDWGNLALHNCTITNNTATIFVGGIRASSPVTLQNTIVAGNMADTDPDCGGMIVSAGYNLLGNTTDCIFTPATGDLTNVDAQLGPLQDNGGATPTHALLSDSPAINAGDPAGCMGSTGLLTADQRGFARFGRCDIGAHEAQSIKTVNQSTALPGDPLTYTVAFQNGSVNIADFRITDTLPISLTYIDNSLTATSGNYGYNNGAITWTGSVNTREVVTIKFGTTVSQTASLGTSIVNSAVISGSGEVITRSATIYVGRRVYLPVVLKNQ